MIAEDAESTLIRRRTRGTGRTPKAEPVNPDAPNRALKSLAHKKIRQRYGSAGSAEAAMTLRRYVSNPRRTAAEMDALMDHLRGRR